METYQQDAIRAQLIDRRHRLSDAIDTSGESAHLVSLLRQVDSALESMNTHTYGLCETCHEAIESDRLMANPLLRLCIDHLTEAQKEALQQDLDLASQVQAGLLPRVELATDGWEASYHYEAAGAVSGDYCELLRPDGNGDLFFALGDVSGKGVAASLLMSHLHAIIRSLVTAGLPLQQLVERANRLFCQSTIPAAFATLVCGKANTSGEVEICNAGHCAPLTFPGDPPAAAEVGGLPLGLFAESQYSVHKFRLAPGQGIFLYTDGLVEARNTADEEYGLDRLAAVLCSKASLPVRELLRACRQDLTAFQSGVPMADDITLMGIRRTVQSRN